MSKILISGINSGVYYLSISSSDILLEKALTGTSHKPVIIDTVSKNKYQLMVSDEDSLIAVLDAVNDIKVPILYDEITSEPNAICLSDGQLYLIKGFNVGRLQIQLKSYIERTINLKSYI